jgi:large subunit ribosomal protein L25
MENVITINAELRKEISKKARKDLRSQGKIMKSENKDNSILRIQQGEKTKFDAMIKDIQYDYLSDHIIHVDFIRIDLNKPVDVEVPILLEGEPIGVKTEDGLLEFIQREILVRSLPTSIPKEIRIDISGLHIGQSIKVENLAKSDAYQLISPANTVICAVAAKAKEEVPEVVAVPEEAEVAAEGAAAAPEAAAGKEKAKEADKSAATSKDKPAAPAKGKEKKEG